MKKEIVYCDRCGEEYRPVWGRIGEDYRILGYMGCKSTYQLHRTFLNKDITMDLCEKCYKELEKWMENTKPNCEDCDYTDIIDWEQDVESGKATPIYWCERYKTSCENIKKCKYTDKENE